MVPLETEPRIHPKKGHFIHFSNLNVSDTADMYQTILRYKELEFHNDIARDIMVFADSDLLCCVIRNLISNAIKYTPNQGTISIECREAKDFITVVVSDSGTGIAGCKYLPGFR